MQQGTICLWRLAAYVACPAQTYSARRRFAAVYGVADLLGLGGKPCLLAVDRTTWDSGKSTINIVMVPVIWNGMGIENDPQMRMPARPNEPAPLPPIRLVIMRIASGELLALACSSRPHDAGTSRYRPSPASQSASRPTR
jgi:hypothetical protein